jgi:hypothetical protein
VRKLLVHYDRYGIIAAFVWFGGCIGIFVVTFVPINQFFLKFTSMGPQLSGFPSTLLISPIVIYICPVFWATGFLIAEQMWMFVGIHSRRGWEPHHFRKIIGRLAGENQ